MVVSAPEPVREFLRKQEVAALFGVSLRTIENWIHAGRLPAVRVGPQQVRIRREDVAAVLTPVRPTRSRQE